MRILLLALVVSAAMPSLDAAPPNVVIMFTDDQGYGDLGCFGHPTIATPNIDRLAAEGMRFTNAYAGYTVCGE